MLRDSTVREIGSNFPVLMVVSFAINFIMNKVFINIMNLKQNTKGNVFQNTASDFLHTIEIPDSFLVELTLTIIALK